jgi:hypothetical protein
MILYDNKKEDKMTWIEYKKTIRKDTGLKKEKK